MEIALLALFVAIAGAAYFIVSGRAAKREGDAFEEDAYSLVPYDSIEAPTVPPEPEPVKMDRVAQIPKTLGDVIREESPPAEKKRRKPRAKKQEVPNPVEACSECGTVKTKREKTANPEAWPFPTSESVAKAQRKKRSPKR